MFTMSGRRHVLTEIHTALGGVHMMSCKANACIVATMVYTLAACAAQVTSSGGRTVVVRAAVPDMGVENALVLAEAECAKLGLSARVQAVTTPQTDRYIFECVRLGN